MLRKFHFKNQYNNHTFDSLKCVNIVKKEEKTHAFFYKYSEINMALFVDFMNFFHRISSPFDADDKRGLF